MKNFLIGCNYWASNAGMKTWEKFDEKVIDKDFSTLSQNGVDTIRIFPTWDAFQEVRDTKSNTPSFNLRDNNEDYLKNPEGINMKQMENFSKMLDLAQKYNLKVIVSIISGWMSGRKFAPLLLINENLISSPKVVIWTCKFVKKFVSYFKDRTCIIAWEPGNECNCLDYNITEDQAEMWLMAITNAIKSEDTTRPIISGMHSLPCRGRWNIPTVSYYTDIQTTHPYPMFTPFCSKEKVVKMRSILHPAAESAYYAGISNQKCLVEEVNTLGPMVLSDDFMPEFIEKSIATSFQYGTNGYLWWCGFDQEHLDFSPYDLNALEQNLGLCYSNGTPKPAIKEIKRMAQLLAPLEDLPTPDKHCCVILSFDQDNWKIAYASFVMAAQCGYTVDFMYEDQPLKDYDYYIVPSIRSYTGLPKITLNALKDKVEKGAKLLISYHGGYIGDFESLTGLKVKGREESNKIYNIKLDEDISIKSQVNLETMCSTAKVIAKDGDNVYTINKYGKGEVHFINADIENYYTDTINAHDTNLYLIYKNFFASLSLPLKVNSKYCTLTFHSLANGNKGVFITSLGYEKEVTLLGNFEIKDVKFATVQNNKLIFDSNIAYLEIK